MKDVIRNPIDQILEMAAKRTAKTETSVDLEQLEVDLSKVREAKRQLMPIEQGSLNRLESIEKDLVRKRLMVQSGLKYENYPEFWMEALTWRNVNGYPRIVPFSLATPNFEIGTIVEYRWSRYRSHKTHTPSLPRPILKLYDDVFALTKAMAKESHKTTKLRASFVGLIPETVRQQIVDTKSHFNQLFVVAEVKKWDLKQSAPILRVDPLLVGWDGFRLWLLASFNTTSIEKYIENMAIEKYAIEATN